MERKGKVGSKRGKKMQNSQKGHHRSQKTMCQERRKTSFLVKEGGGVNIAFRSKYRPLVEGVALCSRKRSVSFSASPRLHEESMCDGMTK